MPPQEPYTAHCVTRDHSRLPYDPERDIRFVTLRLTENCFCFVCVQNWKLCETEEEQKEMNKEHYFNSMCMNLFCNFLSPFATLKQLT